jgi:hypothetical protein
MTEKTMQEVIGPELRKYFLSFAPKVDPQPREAFLALVPDRFKEPSK